MITLEDTAARCDKVRWSGKDSFTALCLGHDDHSPSMSVSERDGKLLFHCHAGCPQSVLLDAFGMTANCEHKPIYTPPTRPKNVVNTTNYAKRIWDATHPNDLISWDGAVASHPYGIKKTMTHAWGAARGNVSGRLVGKCADCIIVPMRTLQGELAGVECINADGVKQAFGFKGSLVLGNTLNKTLPILVTEGWADGVAAMRLYGNVVALVAFGKGKQNELAARVAAARPDRHIIVVEDAA